MKKASCWFLMFLLIFGVSTCNAHAEEWESFVQGHAGEFATEKFDGDYGLTDFWEELVDAYGPFPFWSVEQKNWYSGLLPYLLEAEEQRIQTYHPGWILPFLFHHRRWKTVLRYFFFLRSGKQRPRGVFHQHLSGWRNKEYFDRFKRIDETDMIRS